MKWSYCICVTNSTIENLLKHSGHFSVSAVIFYSGFYEITPFCLLCTSPWAISKSSDLNIALQIGQNSNSSFLGIIDSFGIIYYFTIDY